MKKYIASAILGLACLNSASTASAQTFYSTVNPGPGATLSNPQNDITAQVSVEQGWPLFNYDLTSAGFSNVNGTGLNATDGGTLDFDFSATITSFQINWAACDNDTPTLLDVNAYSNGNAVGSTTSPTLLIDNVGYDEGAAVYNNANGFNQIVLSFDPSSLPELLCVGSDVSGTGSFGNQTVALVPTPEPAPIALAVLGGLSLLLYRRRK